MDTTDPVDILDVKQILQTWSKAECAKFALWCVKRIQVIDLPDLLYIEATIIAAEDAAQTIDAAWAAANVAAYNI